MSNIEIESLRDEKRRISATIMHNNEARNELYTVNKHGIRFSPLNVFIIYWIIDLVIVLFTVCYALAVSGSVLAGVLFLSFMAIAIAVVNLLLIFPRVRKVRKIDADNRELSGELRRIDERIKALESEE